MGTMKDMLDTRLDRNKWGMWELLKELRDGPRIGEWDLKNWVHRVVKVLDKIESLEEESDHVG